MAILGKAALAVWLECLPDAEDDFNRWYVEQHLAERVGLPGFLRGCRYRALRGTPKYFAFYEAESVDIFRSPTYLERLNNPTDWTRRVMPTVRNFTRGVYRLVRAVGGTGDPGAGHVLVTLRLDPAPGQDATLRLRYRDEGLEALGKAPGVISATLLEMDREATGGFTEERKLIGASAAAAPFACLCEVRDAAVADHPAWRAALGLNGPARGDAVRDVTEGVYRLLHALSRPQA